MRRTFALICLTVGLMLSACAPATAPDVTPPADAALAFGYEVYGEYCQSCHWVTPTDERGKAPSLAGIASRAGETVAGLDARAYIEQSILQPGVHLVPGYRNNMPDNYASRLAPEELEAVINYLLTLE